MYKNNFQSFYVILMIIIEHLLLHVKNLKSFDFSKYDIG